MAPAGHPGEDAALYDTVRAVAMELCPALGISIPVGKDSMSMRTTWRDEGRDKAVTAPVSLIVTAFAPVEDARRALTPLLRRDCGDTELVWIDLGAGKRRLGGSALAQVYGQLGDVAPDLDDPARLAAFFAAIQELPREGRLLAYHDIGDGGLFATLCEMAFASRCGLELALDAAGAIRWRRCSPRSSAPSCRSRPRTRADVIAAARGGRARRPRDRRTGGARPDPHSRAAGRRCSTHRASTSIARGRRPRTRMQRLRDNPECADEEYARLADATDPGLSPVLTFDPAEDIAAPYIATGARPAIAILREQGVNGQVEMAAAFDRAGFAAIDVHMTDILAGRRTLADFRALRRRRRLFLRRRAGRRRGLGQVDPVQRAGARRLRGVLRARRHVRARRVQRLPDDEQPVGAHSGRRPLAALRAQQVRAVRRPPRAARSAALAVALLHAAWKAAAFRSPRRTAKAMPNFATPRSATRRSRSSRCASSTTAGEPTEAYPFNPNGSPDGVTGLTTADGRYTILMPHPERVFRTVQMSWHPREWGEDSPWMRMFRNARAWLAMKEIQ